jgi:YggT family protein
MDIILFPFLAVLSTVIGIYSWIVILAVVMSWLINFNVINLTNNFIVMVAEFLYRATEPVLRRICRFLPQMGGFDLSPVVLILLLWFLQLMIGRVMLKLVVVSGA